MRISDWSSDVCSSDLGEGTEGVARLRAHGNQAMSKAGRATAQSRIVIAEQGLVDQPGHDLPAAMGANGIIQDVRNLQGAALYEAGQHVSLPDFVATLRFADMWLPSSHRLSSPFPRLGPVEGRSGLNRWRRQRIGRAGGR